VNDQLWWYTARAGGIVAWALLAASVLWGLAISTKALRGKTRPNWMLDMHRFLGAAALVFTGIHVASIMLDSYVSFSLVQVLVPFTSTWKPSAVAWGIVAMWLLAAVEITSLIRNRIPQRIWRLTHVLAFPLFALSTVHIVMAGTDSGNVLLRWALILVNLAVVGLTLHRLRQLDRRGAPVPVGPSRIPAGVRASTGSGIPPGVRTAAGSRIPAGVRAGVRIDTGRGMPTAMPSEPPMEPEDGAVAHSRLSPGRSTLA
jgi:DMSO/TMAO reductase YedYZ heme-binding membrane subunit